MCFTLFNWFVFTDTGTEEESFIFKMASNLKAYAPMYNDYVMSTVKVKAVGKLVKTEHDNDYADCDEHVCRYKYVL